MSTELSSFILIMMVVAALMLLGEGLYRIFRAPRQPQKEETSAQADIADEVFEYRYSIRHLERYFLILFASLLAYLLLLARGLSSETLILIIGCAGVWWAFRRGVLR